MSQATVPIPRMASASLARPQRQGAPSSKPHLEALPRAERRARPKLFYASVAVATVMLVVVTQLMLSIGVSQGAYRIEALQNSKAQLSREYQTVSERVEALSSPQNLAANAAALGMVDDGTPVYLRLSDGKVIGSPAPAGRGAATSQLIANALTQDIPLVTGQSQNPTVAKSSAPPKAGTTPTGAATSAQQGHSESGTPGANGQTTDAGPVPWTGALPAPTTH